MSDGPIRFGVFELDPRAGELRRQGRTTRLQDKPLQLLRLLLERPRELVNRDEIRERIWGPSPYFDFDDSLNQAVSKLREALGDSASNPRFIETIPRRGYRFIAPVEVRTVAGNGETAAVSPAGLPPTRRVTVGRQSELAQLGEQFRAAAAGEGSVVCLTGEPGIGKTTLLDSFLQSLDQTRGAFRVLRGRCSERLAGEEAYLPLLEALESLLASGGDAEAMKRVAPAWYAQVAPPGAIDPALTVEVRGATQERLKREWAALVDALTRDGPLLLCLDDVHWADISTVDILAYLGMRCDGRRLLIVATYRPADLSLGDPAFRRVQLELEGRGLCREIALGFLDEGAIERYLELEFPGNRFPRDLAAQIHRYTEGNPLFMTDLVRHMRDRGLLRRSGEAWEADPLAFQERMELPRSIRAMVQRMIERLPDEDRRLLAAGAVQGQEFDAAVVASVVGLDAEEVERRLAALDNAHEFIRQRGDRAFPDLTVTPRYSFVHALYQNALYDSLTPAQRASQSAAAAGALIDRYGERSAQLAVDLGHLFEAAKDAAQASMYFLLAARNAVRVAANREAEKLARRAIEQAERLRGDDGHKLQIEATLLLGEVYEISGQYKEQIAAFRSAEALAAEAGNAAARVEAACGQATGAFWQKRVSDMQAHSRRALELATQHGDGQGTALAEVILAREQLCLGDVATAGTGFDRSLPALDAAGLSFQAVDAATFAIMLHSQRLEFERARQASDWWLERARETGVPSYKHHFLYGIALGNHGQIEEAMRLVREGIRLAELNGNRHYACRLYNTLGWLHGEIGDTETSNRLNSQGARVSSELGNEEAEFNSLINLARNFLEEGETGRAWECLQAAERAMGQSVWFQWRFRIRMEAESAYYWIAQGDPARASDHARRAIELAGPAMARKHAAWGHKLLGDAAALADQPEHAAREYEAALAELAGHACPPIEWKIWRSLADARRSLRLSREADEALARAKVLTESLAGAITDESLRRKFLGWKAVRDLASR